MYYDDDTKGRQAVNFAQKPAGLSRCLPFATVQLVIQFWIAPRAQVRNYVAKGSFFLIFASQGVQQWVVWPPECRLLLLN
jgi:hypothetical protein